LQDGRQIAGVAETRTNDNDEVLHEARIRTGLGRIHLLNRHVLIRCVRYALALSLYMGASLPSQASNALPPPLVDVRAWPRMSVGAFGCYLQKDLGYRDARFNCGLKNYRNTGDPCKNTRAYYEGPKFPVSLVSRVHPLATDVELAWEHGELQSVSITLKGTWNEAEVRRAFKLPRAPSENLMDVSVQYPMHGSTAVILIGFEHIGAGDVDCDTR
jgi:hypothetical protein